MILADVSQLDEQFQVTELGDFEGMLLLELKSLDSESEFERILLGLTAGDSHDGDGRCVWTTNRNHLKIS